MRKKNNIESYDDRGAYLMKVLGLDKVKTTRKPTVKKAPVVNNPYEDAANKKWDFKKEDFSTKWDSENGWIVTHKSWDDVYITNNERYIVTEEDAMKFIDEYIKNSKRPLKDRDTFVFHLVND